MDISRLDNIIIGKLHPKIYAFTTGTVPSYLKVGDTYRPLNERLGEWRKYFKDLELRFNQEALADENHYFRDYAVHDFLKKERGRATLTKEKAREFNAKYSNEFFENATSDDVADAIKDIIENFGKTTRYEYYNRDIEVTDLKKSRSKSYIMYRRIENFPMRDNQAEVVKNFKKAYEAGRKNLLMYAVMRFGKSFTAMNCALAMDARLVVIVSAKFDVLDEWKYTVESHEYFKDYVFMTAKKLNDGDNVLTDELNKNKVVVFLSLQDLQGDGIKKKHAEVFKSSIDLLLIDECHYGVRTPKYGAVLKEFKYKEDKEDNEFDEDDNKTLEFDAETKKLKSRVRIHLSGTPYRLLMGSEFKPEDIIGFVQYSDIIDARDEWSRKEAEENVDYDETKNPYYGFPQMVRFAFNPDEQTARRIEQLKQQGFTCALSQIFKTRISPKTKKPEFVYADEILSTFKAIDGVKEDSNVFGFLNYDKIKEGKMMCRHMVCVLPTRSACDALELLLKKHAGDFINLQNYKVINIAGHATPYRGDKSVEQIKYDIAKAEQEDEPTLSLTVRRMLTGVTVPQWDTMIYLKECSSAQEYDQAIFRLQSPNVQTYKYKNGHEEKVMKIDKKPQTLLVDFDPERMFRLQETKAFIYNVNTDTKGNIPLEQRLKRELEISPILQVSNDALCQVSPTDIIKAVMEYSASRSIIDEAMSIDIDYSLIENPKILEAIRGLKPIDAPKGIDISAHGGDKKGGDVSTDDKNEEGKDPDKHKDTKDVKDPKEVDTLPKRLKTYLAKILFFALLTEERVKSLEEVVQVMDSNEDNIRIASNLGMSKEILQEILDIVNPGSLGSLDNSIYQANLQISDPTVESSRRVEIAMKRFGRMSESEIVTPRWLAREMVEQLPLNPTDPELKVLDIASKQGEFTVALIDVFGEAIKDKVYSIPTSPLAYELTRKVYKLLNIPIEHIYSTFTSYDLIDKEKSQTIIPTLKQMNFQTIVGNPPYNKPLSAGRSLSKQLYPDFMKTSVGYKPLNIAMITPSRWFTADAQDNSFPKLRQFIKENNHISKISTYNGKKVFPSTDLNMVNYFIWQDFYSGEVKFIENIYEKVGCVNRPLFEENMNIVIPQNSSVPIINKIMRKKFISLSTISSGRNAFGIVGKNIKKITKGYEFEGSVKVRCAYEEYRFMSRSEINRGLDYLDKYKVFTSKGNGGAGLLTDGKPVNIIGKSYVASPGEACTDSLIPFGKFSTEKEAQNLQKYMCTKFLRFCVGILKVSQNLYQNVYRLVPMQDFATNDEIDWSKSVEEIDKLLYAKYDLSKEESDFIEAIIKPM